MAININFDNIDRRDIEYYRHLKLMHYSDDTIFILMELFKKSRTYMDMGSKIDNTPGRVIRKPKPKKYESNPFYKNLPFGISEEGKIILPEFYKLKLMDVDPDISIETVYNICMCTQNIHFWFLMTFDQKNELYSCIRKHGNVKLFGYRDRGYTLGDLLCDLTRFCFVFDSVTVELLRKLGDNTICNTPEFKQMISQNVRKIITLNDFIVYVNDYMNYDPLIKASLYDYLPFTFHLVSDRLEFKKLNEGDFYINGSPKIANISFKEPPR